MFNPHRQHHKINALARSTSAAISPDSTARCDLYSQLFRAIASLALHMSANDPNGHHGYICVAASAGTLPANNDADIGPAQTDLAATICAAQGRSYILPAAARTMTSLQGALKSVR